MSCTLNNIESTLFTYLFILHSPLPSHMPSLYIYAHFSSILLHSYGVYPAQHLQEDLFYTLFSPSLTYTLPSTHMLKNKWCLSSPTSSRRFALSHLGQSFFCQSTGEKTSGDGITYLSTGTQGACVCVGWIDWVGLIGLD